MITFSLAMAILLSVAALFFGAALFVGHHQYRDAGLGAAIYTFAALLFIWSIWAAWQ